MQTNINIKNTKETQKTSPGNKRILDQLVPGIVHEIRNSMTSVKGFFTILKDKNDANELYYKIIEDELASIEQILFELSTLANPYTGEQKNHNLIELIKEVKLFLSHQNNVNPTQINVVTSCDKVFVTCNGSDIKQVILNLLKNSIHAMDHGGIILVKVYENKDHVQIQIIDQGNGISREKVKKLGEPFFSTHEKGTGISMMACYRIIENHGGSIQVESKMGLGTTFTIQLPK